MIKLANEYITIEINTLGAELTSLIDNKTNENYLWYGDKAHWGSRSPILFPFVGGCKNKEYHYGKKTYEAAQHGFARKMEFEVEEKTDDTVWLFVKSNEETIKKYPFDFKLLIGYKIVKKTVNVMFKVINETKGDMYFSIGGHPGFICPLSKEDKKTDYSIKFDNIEDNIKSTLITSRGLASDEKYVLATKKGILPITDNMFDNDALVIENNQVQKISILDKNKKSYVTVKFDTELVGIWAPTKDAPFICIEPWYGRCDGDDFDGTLEERAYINLLKENEIFEKSYSIELD